jgi:hypothetical protein
MIKVDLGTKWLFTKMEPPSWQTVHFYVVVAGRAYYRICGTQTAGRSTRRSELGPGSLFRLVRSIHRRRQQRSWFSSTKIASAPIWHVGSLKSSIR